MAELQLVKDAATVAVQDACQVTAVSVVERPIAYKGIDLELARAIASLRHTRLSCPGRITKAAAVAVSARLAWHSTQHSLAGSRYSCVWAGYRCPSMTCSLAIIVTVWGEVLHNNQVPPLTARRFTAGCRGAETWDGRLISRTFLFQANSHLPDVIMSC